MLLLGFILGLLVGIGLWAWQRIQIKRTLGKIPPTFTTNFSQVRQPLIPRLEDEITFLKQQREQLQQQVKNYQNILEFSPLGYLQVDEENQLLWCNQQARQILSLERWQAGELRLLLELVRSYELDQLIEQTRDRQQSEIGEWVFHPSCEQATAMLEVKPLLLRATSLPLENQEVAVFLENRQALVDINKTRDRAFSDLAHELRTPLTSIRLVVETLQNRVEPPFNRLVHRLLQEVDRLINLIQNWLDLTQIETNPSIQLNRQPVEVRSLIASVWQTLEPLGQRQQIQIVYSGEETVWINADKSRMYQVFLNLLDNSIKYSPAGGTIHVETKIISGKDSHSSKIDSSPRLEINIMDSGEGFSQEDLPHVFERFYRGDKARSRPPTAKDNAVTLMESSGLGLAIVRQLILAHGGKIEAMNHPQTGGAWLQVSLPEVMANPHNQDYI
ncbi:MAG: ATP-binding protein [Nostocaceae cyanobacterium]|nr:ATP-binding protein [Nostocaceae cyanobacterium]